MQQLTNCIFLLLLGFQLNAQKFVNTSNEWVISNYQWSFIDFDKLEGTSYITFGDTITLDGKVFRKLEVDATHPNIAGFYYDYYREESGKVFGIGTWGTLGDEQLIYDFNLSEGDTFNLNWVVKTVDNLELNSLQKRKRIEFENINPIFDNKIWVEGIGCIENFTMVNYTVQDAWDTFSCYYTDGNLELEEGSIYCAPTVSTEDVNQRTYFDINPNPVDDSFDISHLELDRDEFLEVYNIHGQKMPIDDYKNSDELDASNFSSGFYFVILKKDGRKIGQSRFIKI